MSPSEFGVLGALAVVYFGLRLTLRARVEQFLRQEVPGFGEVISDTPERGYGWRLDLMKRIDSGHRRGFVASFTLQSTLSSGHRLSTRPYLSLPFS